MFENISTSVETNRSMYDRKLAEQYNNSSLLFKCRLSQKCDVAYRENAKKFEVKLAEKALVNKEVHHNADKMLKSLRQMVYAWQESISPQKSEKENLESELGIEKSNCLYYGAIETSAKNITNIFDGKNQQLRLKYRLIYNAIINGNLNKWLKTLAFQYSYNVAKVKIKEEENKPVVVQEFDKNLGSRMIKYTIGEEKLSFIKDFISVKDDEKSKTDKELKPDEKSKKIVELKPFNREGAIEQHPSMKINYLSRSSAKNLTGHMGEQENRMRRLTKKEVPDLTKEEWNFMGFKRKPKENEQLNWTQGSEDVSLLHGTSMTKEINAFKARMEAGVSGTTDLMIHAAEYLGIKDSRDKKILRMGLLGWMVKGGDHSFYEIYKSADKCGIEFKIDKKKIGSEYENGENLTPFSLQDVKPILNGKFPSYYYSEEYLFDLYKKNLGLPSTKNSEKIEEGITKEQYISSFMDFKPKFFKLIMQYCSEEQLPYVEGLVNLIKREQKDAISLTLLENKQHKYREIKRDINYIFLANTLGEEEFSDIIIELFQQNGYPFEFIAEVLKDRKETKIAKVKKEIMEQHIKEENLDKKKNTNEELKLIIQDIEQEEEFSYRVDRLRVYEKDKKWRKLSKDDWKKLDVPKKVKEEQKEKTEEAIFNDYWGINIAKQVIERKKGNEVTEINKEIITKMKLETCKKIFADEKWKDFIEGLIPKSVFKDKYEEKNFKKIKDDIKIIENMKNGNNKRFENTKELIFEFISNFIQNTFDMEDDVTSKEKVDKRNEFLNSLKKIEELNSIYGSIEENEKKWKILKVLDEKELGALTRYTTIIYKAMNASSSELKKGVNVADLEGEPEDKMYLKDTAPLILAAASGLTKLPKYEKNTYRIRNLNLRKVGERRELGKQDIQKAKKILANETEGTLGQAFLSSAKTIDSSYIKNHWNDVRFDTLEYITCIKTGHDIQNLSQCHEEEEVLFEPGARFKVTSIKLAEESDRIPEDKRDKYHIVVEKEEYK